MSSHAPCIVSTDWLSNELKNTKGGLAVLDATWFSDKDAIKGFSKQHIIHASHMDIFFGVENRPMYPRNIPDALTFQMNARGSAVNSSDHVVIYENTGKYGFFLGARTWWMFKLFGHENVSVLDGGLERWIADSNETTNMMAKKGEGDFIAKFNPKWIVNFEDMVENLTSHKAQVCDSRIPAKFNHSPDDPKSGHYPGAVNIPFPSLFNPETRTLKTVDELKKVYTDAGIDLTKPVIGMCLGGMSSCTLVLVAHLCGCPNTALYHNIPSCKCEVEYFAVHPYISLRLKPSSCCILPYINLCLKPSSHFVHPYISLHVKPSSYCIYPYISLCLKPSCQFINPYISLRLKPSCYFHHPYNRCPPV